MAGQVVMEGFLSIRMRPWLRRLITRALAVTPAALTIYLAGDKATLGLLLLSQAVLSMQLPFAVVPLIHFTSDPARMGSFRNRPWVKILAWVTAAIIIGLNVWLLAETIGDWLAAAGRWRTVVWLVTVPVGLGLGGLLMWITLEPWIARRKLVRSAVELPEMAGAATEEAPVYHRILVPLDHTHLDRLAVSHAAAMARLYGARLYLLHVEEGVTSQLYGQESSTAEVEAGEHYLERIAQSLRDQQIEVETSISHSTSPKKEIVRYAREIHSDLVIMGAHGHGGLKDLIFGNTINPVRHNLNLPMLIVRPGKS
jgi:manganese transport protein